MERITATVAYPSRCILGEGSLWDEDNHQLLWVDILDHKIYCFNPVTGANTGFDVGQDVGTVVLSESGDWVFADQDGIAMIDPKRGKITRGIQPEKGNANIRFNEGKCDPRGEFWCGTMDYDCVEGAGKLYAFSGMNEVVEKISDVTISNGLVWSADNKKFYYIDSMTYQVHCYDYDLATGNICNKRVFCPIDKDMGVPDGMAIDCEDHLWVALFYGGKVIRLNPKTGSICYEIDVPAPNVTSCAFGGEILDELYITTARDLVSEEDLKKYPLSGSLFKAKVPFKGVGSYKMKI